MSPERIQRQRTKGWRMPEGAVYVGRPTRWGNPFKVCESLKPRGFTENWSVWDQTDREVYANFSSKADAHAYATELYRSWLTSGSIHGLARKPLRAWMGPLHTEIHRRLPTLHGHDLACWCPPARRLVCVTGVTRLPLYALTCHADVLLELASQEAHSGGI